MSGAGRIGRRGLLTAALTVMAVGCAATGPSPVAPKVTVGVAAVHAVTEHADPVQLLASGSEPRAALRYRLPMGSSFVVRGELAMFQPVYRYEAKYAVEPNGDGFVLTTSVRFDMANTMLGLFGAAVPRPPDCTASVTIDSRGLLNVDSTDSQCALVERSLYGFRETPLRPAIPLPKEPIGVGARWSVAAAPAEPRASYTLLDVNDGIWTVWGELESTRAARAESGAFAVPSAASMLVRLASTQLVRSATLGWAPVADKSTRAKVPIPSSSPKKMAALIRLNAVADGVPNARDEMRAAIERALGGAEPVHTAAIEASGVTSDWRLIEPLLGMDGSDVNRALELLTHRTARGPEDWLEAAAPYFCRGDAAKSEAILTRGIQAGGEPEIVGKLLALRAAVRSLGENVDGATADFRDALARSPGDPEVVRVVAWWLSTGPDAARDARRALTLLASVSGNDGYLALFAQAKAAALAEQSNFTEAKRIQEQAVAALNSAATAFNNASGSQRTEQAQVRLDAYAHRLPWRHALTPNESPLCYRFFGLSNTLL